MGWKLQFDMLTFKGKLPGTARDQKLSLRSLAFRFQAN